jgi:phosphoribosylanthranilate isomerase
MKRFHKLVLAGGLNPQNIVEAIKTVQPYAVDVNSGVELEPGRKDQKKVFSLFKQLSNIA